jgi:hypothetical protein
VELMDYDVVGIGGQRREEIKQERRGQNVTLVLHKGGSFNPELFAAALESTLVWLKPEQIRYEIWPASERNAVLLKTAIKNFPRSFQRDPQTMSSLIQAYNLEKPFTDWLVLEHYSYLPLWAHRQKIQPQLESLLRFEVNQVLLSQRDFGFSLSPGPFFQANSTLQIYKNEADLVPQVPANEICILYVQPQTLQVKAEKLMADEVRILDLLEEGLKLNRQDLLQLILTFEWADKKDSSAWAEKIKQMLEKGLIIGS